MKITNFRISKIAILLQRIALLLFSILPIGLGLLSQIDYLRNNWTILLFVQMGLFVGLLLLPLILILLKDGLWKSIEKKEYIPLFWIVLFSIALRLIILPLLSTNFTSDFEDIHNFAIDVASGHSFANLSNYPSIPWATHLNITGLVMSVVYRIFGIGFSTAKMFMLVLSALTVYLVYLTGKELAGSHIGFISASIYGTLPSLVCYTGVLTGENFALPLVTLAILLYVRLKKTKNIKPLYYATGFVLCGATIGVMDWFRPGGVILILALIITELIYLTKEGAFQKHIIPLTLLAASYLTVGNLAVTISESFFHTDIMATSQKSGYFILIGLNPETQGRIKGNISDREISFEAYDKFKDDNSAANKYLIQLAFDRLKGHSLWDLFRSKFILVWSNHEQLFGISLNGSNDYEVVEVMMNIDSFITLIITLLIGVGIVSSFMKSPEPAVFAMQLFILGCAIWLLILEVQNRYGIIMFPYLILLGSLGMNSLTAYIRRYTQQPLD